MRPGKTVAQAAAVAVPCVVAIAGAVALAV